MARDKRGLLALLGACTYLAALSCSGNAFTHKGDETAAASGQSASAAGVAGSGTSTSAGTAGASAEAGTAGVAASGGGNSGLGGAGAGGAGGLLLGGAGNGGLGGAGNDPSEVIPKLGLLYWFKADSGVEATEGISKWQDQSGNGHHASQKLGALRPKLAMDQAVALPLVAFDGEDDFLELPPVTVNNSAGLSFFAVLGHAHETVCSGVLELSNGPEKDDISFATLDNRFQFEINDDTAFANAGSFPVNRIALVEVLHSTSMAKPTAVLRVDGVNVGTGGVRPAEPLLRSVNYLGATGYSDCQPFSGAIGELIVYTRLLLDVERSKVESYLAKRWNCCSPAQQ